MFSEAYGTLLDTQRAKLEQVMLELDPNKSQAEHSQYLAGWIDGLAEMGHLPETVREILYNEYVINP